MAEKRTTTQAGKRAIRAIFEDAKRELEDDLPPFAPDPNEPRGDDIKPGQWPGYPDNAMPPNCPITVLGRDIEGVVYVVTATGHLRAVTKWDNATLTDLFAPLVNEAKWAWPAWTKPKKDSNGDIVVPALVNRIERDPCAAAIIQEAARRPDFDPARQVRGRGGWKDRNGDFIWHSGGYLWRRAAGGKKLERARPSEYDGFLYSRLAPTIEPWSEPVAVDESPAARILGDLRTWQWARRDLDPVLALGWIGCSLMGGALDQRPIVFTTGGAGVGKTTLQELLKNVLDNAVFASVDTTAAGIYQRVKQDSLPIIIDELENKPGSTRSETVIDLARVAYTGGDISRGGADHQGTTFRMHSSFMMSAINPPPMTTADKTRMAVLNLNRLDRANGMERKVDVSLDTDGRMLLRQVMDGWRDFNERIYQNYWDALHHQGLDSRAINTFGTLLAAAELLVGEALLEDIGLPVTEPARLGELVADATRLERAEQLDNWHRCLNHLLQSAIEAWKSGDKLTVGGVLEEIGLDQRFDLANGKERLAAVNLGGRIDDGKLFLGVPRDGPMLKRVFADTEWKQSVWYDALKQAPADIVLQHQGNRHKIKINGSTVHCLLVDLKAFAEFVEGGELE